MDLGAKWDLCVLYVQTAVKIANLSEPTVQFISNCVQMNKNSSPESMMKVYLSWRIMFDMVCEPL